MGRKSQTGGVEPKGNDRIQFTITIQGTRYRPTIAMPPTEANLRRARLRRVQILKRIANGTFSWAEEFPDFQVASSDPSRRPDIESKTCNQVFDEFLDECESRVAMSDLTYTTFRGYRKLLNQIWRPAIGSRRFFDIVHSELSAATRNRMWSKKTYNNAISAAKCAFAFGYRDKPERFNPAEAFTCKRITKKDRRPINPFTVSEAEELIAQIHADWGEALGNYDEFRFFTGLRPSEQIALLPCDVDVEKAVLHVTKARVLRRNKDRPKNGIDRTLELCPRAIEVVTRQLQLRQRLVTQGLVDHPYLFFLDDGKPIADPEVTRWRWNESLAKLPHIQHRGGYHARHSSVTWRLMINDNLLKTAQEHGHSVQVMLDMYAKWMIGATAADLDAIRQARQSRPQAGAASTKSAAASMSSESRPLEPPKFATNSPPAAGRKRLDACSLSRKSGGEGGIRTHVPELPDHPISSRRRYDHFGTSPAVPLRGLVF